VKISVKIAKGVAKEGVYKTAKPIIIAEEGKRQLQQGIKNMMLTYEQQQEPSTAGAGKKNSWQTEKSNDG
jgi:hypothetical protein